MTNIFGPVTVTPLAPGVGPLTVQVLEVRHPSATRPAFIAYVTTVSTVGRVTRASEAYGLSWAMVGADDAGISHVATYGIEILDAGSAHLRVTMPHPRDDDGAEVGAHAMTRDPGEIEAVTAEAVSAIVRFLGGLDADIPTVNMSP